jgi:hypothetical protein
VLLVGGPWIGLVVVEVGNKVVTHGVQLLSLNALDASGK